MHRAIKVRIYPNKTQAKKLSQVMGCCRWWYNYARVIRSSQSQGRKAKT
ncbi:helix-turn-helix domain-containing protein [Cyanobacterium aponinum UTEX 3222]|nr:helix-turn-helix domain-containing protein [Cyanobacterium aponinum UTEX 3222]WRL41944.1 helix-turn-helix domain-containing protein [Cyanobacterium aponinum UTEX 3222]WRL42191.1 helix-turn-helix domain-containing protein [Cyanobacterium aponinum UTEX 3222]WRL42989.1 helix-turn-helix domain-containing protein [Cyanobacterium aponinum UTEX 3222]